MSLIKTEKELEALRASGRILAHGVEETLKAVRPGISTEELDALFEETIRGLGAEPSFLGYQGYPKSICTSINDEVVHGIPGKRILKEGDIIGVDCGVRYNGMCTDMARTVAVGSINSATQQLITVTEEALRIGIQQARPGNTTGDIGSAIEGFIQPYGYGIVRVLVGHGVGESVHEDPQVPNYGSAGSGTRLEVGMAIAIEPMVNIGGDEVVMDDDEWTVRTDDSSLSAHFEDTLLITAQGPEVVTK